MCGGGGGGGSQELRGAWLQKESRISDSEVPSTWGFGLQVRWLPSCKVTLSSRCRVLL